MDKTVNRKPGVGDKIYWFDSWGTLQTGKIVGIVAGTQSGTPMADIRSGKNGGISTGAYLDRCFLTKQECIDNKAREKEELRKSYVGQIKTPQDFARFVLTHNVSGEPEYGDELARQIAIEAAKTLFGVEVSE